MTIQRITIFGGTGFLGRRVVECLLARGLDVRIATRHPRRIQTTKGSAGRPEPVRADVRNADSVARAIEGVQAIMNAVGLYVEHGDETFDAIHVNGARLVAEQAREHGVSRLVHVSGIGSDSTAASPYIRVRGEGEEAVRQVFDGATIFRPSVMCGPDDAFLTTLVGLVRRFPLLPLFGNGETRLQPAFVGDVAEAAAHALAEPQEPEAVYELGGPDVLTYREIIELVAHKTGRKRLLVPVPYAGWRMIVKAAGILPNPPLTEGQVALMKRDNVASPDLPGLRDLRVRPAPVETVLDRML